MMCLAISNNLFVLLDVPQNAFSFLRTRDLQVSLRQVIWSAKITPTQRHFFPPTFHPLSMVIFATPTVLAFVLLSDSRFNL